jgi:zinc protease
MRRATRLIVLTLLLTAVPLVAKDAPTRPDHPGQLKFEPLEFQIPKTVRKVLSNGMVLHLIENHELPLVTVNAWLRGGTIYDPADKVGLSVLTGIVMRAGGSEAHPADAYDEELDRLSASIGTSFDSEHAEAGLDVLARNLDAGLALYAELLLKPAFPARTIGMYKQQMLAAYMQRNDDPGGIADRKMMGLLYGDHPYAYQATPQTINAITRDDLVALHAKVFVPNNIILGIAGDFDTDAMTKKIEGLFGGWKTAEVEMPLIAAVAKTPNPGVYHVERELTQSTIRMGHLGVKRNTEERVKADLMNRILGGGGFGSRLVGAVRVRSGLAYSVYSYFTRAIDLGTFRVGTETKSASTWKVIGIILDEINLMREEVVDEKELELAKGMILNGFVFGFENPSDVVEAYVSLEYYGYPADWYDRYLGIVRAMTLEEIREVAKRRIQPEDLSIVIVGKAADLDERPVSMPEPKVIPLD